MLGFLAWLRGTRVDDVAALAREARIPNDTNDAPPTVLNDVPPDDQAPDTPTHVWDRDPHAALQVQRYRELQYVLSEKGMPPELVRHILLLADEARMLSVTRAETMVYTDDANECYLRTPPIPSKLRHHFLRRIVVDIDSHDQGWSGERNRSWLGTYQGSYTWWELTLERRNEQGEWEEVHRTHLTHNIHASREFRRHTLEFHMDDSIALDAQPDDRLCVYARTQFAAWVNIVRYARISIWLDWDA